MNYFTTEYRSNADLVTKKKLVKQDSGCKHVRMNANLVYAVHYEKDGFGVVASHAVCEVCENERKEVELIEMHQCFDCKMEVPRKDGIMWKYWDHSQMEGDEPTFICKCCEALPVHVRRKVNDAADYAAECGPDYNDD